MVSYGSHGPYVENMIYQSTCSNIVMFRSKPLDYQRVTTNMIVIYSPNIFKDKHCGDVVEK